MALTNILYWLIDYCLMSSEQWFICSVYTVGCRVMVRVIVFSATFNNISAISYQSVLLVEETGVHGENHRPVASHWQTSSHKVVSSTPCHEWGSNSQLKWWWALIAQVVLNPTTIRSRPQFHSIKLVLITCVLRFTLQEGYRFEPTPNKIWELVTEILIYTILRFTLPEGYKFEPMPNKTWELVTEILSAALY